VEKEGINRPDIRDHHRSLPKRVDVPQLHACHVNSAALFLPTVI
jgi:hypothetical protein